MNEITRENFPIAYPKLETILRDSTFVSVDLEFLGLPQSTPASCPSILDSPSERHAKNCISVRQFPACQLGLSIYTEKERGKSYDIHVYRVYLFKELCGNEHAPPAFSTISLSFLHHHAFDFNKWVKVGVSYANSKEIQNIKERISDGISDARLFGESFCLWLDRLRAKMKVLLNEEIGFGSPDVIPQWESVDTDKVIDLCAPIKEDASQSKANAFAAVSKWPKPLSRLEANALLYDFTLRYPSLSFRIEKGEKLYIKRCPYGVPHQQRVATTREKLIGTITGASEVIKMLSKLRKPLILHNASLDLLYLYDHFIDDLSADYSTAKRQIHRAFPTVIDTKYLAVMSTGILRDRRPELLGKLGGLKTYIEMENNARHMAYDSPRFDVLSSTKDALRTKSKTNLHDAAFDSMISGKIFLKLAHIFVLARGKREKLTCASSSSTTIAFRDLLYEIRAYIVNKIPLSFSGTQFINLSGEDAEASNYYRLTLRKRLTTEMASTGFVFWRRYVEGCAVITVEEENDLRETLERIGGRWRCDMRIEENRHSAVIACCSNDIYSKIFGMYSSHTIYQICGNGQVIRKPNFMPSLYGHMLGVSRLGLTLLLTPIYLSRSVIVFAKGNFVGRSKVRFSSFVCAPTTALFVASVVASGFIRYLIVSSSGAH